MEAYPGWIERLKVATNKIIKRRSKFPAIPGMDQELDNLISQLSHKDNLAPNVVNNFNGAAIDDTEPIEQGSLQETYSSFKINEIVGGHVFVPEYCQVWGLQAQNIIEDSEMEGGVLVSGRDVILIWEEVNKMPLDKFDVVENVVVRRTKRLDNEAEYLLRRGDHYFIEDYSVWMHVRATKELPQNFYPRIIHDSPLIDNYGWFYAGSTKSNTMRVQVPLVGFAAFVVGFKHINTVSSIDKSRIYNYKN